jgi:hypothetical protein
MNEMQEHATLTATAKRIYKETGRPYWQIEEEVFADFWQRHPDWAPEAVAARKANGVRFNSVNEFEDQ